MSVVSPTCRSAFLAIRDPRTAKAGLLPQFARGVNLVWSAVPAPPGTWRTFEGIAPLHLLASQPARPLRSFYAIFPLTGASRPDVQTTPTRRRTQTGRHGHSDRQTVPVDLLSTDGWCGSVQPFLSSAQVPS
ncbi:unnamed protein product [Protopolystoma xenopodis]|uniref:Uncharacterized protein n=1 Tax=Protopolystoma xenopodis TaxID=117903 RepID=A0A3S5BGF1_9PLAT|nr:unnamed protein product [Protopolystoma xenopodis]